MTKNQYTEPEITLRELLAVIIRGGRCVLVLAVVLALVLGLTGLTSALGSDLEQDDEYRLALDTYTMNKEQRETTVARLKKEVENQKDYLQKSLLMKMDPYNKHVTTMTFAISGIVATSAKESFAADETPISYMTQRIQAQYNSLWNQMDLEKMAEGTAYAGVDEKYLREVITLSVEEGGVLLLSIAGSDGASNGKIANAVYAALEASESAVEKASYVHDFVMLHDVNDKVVVDTELEKKQLEGQNKIETAQKEILKLEEELLKLQEPAAPSGMMSVVKKAILGGIVGAVLAMAWLVCSHLLSTKVTASQKLAGDLSLTYLGNSAQRRGVWERLAQKTMGEHAWKDEAKAVAYIKEKGVAHIPETATVAVVSSLTHLNEESVNRVVEALGGNGRVVAFGSDAVHDAETLALMRSSTGIVLLEHAFESKTATVADVMAVAEGLNKPVYGFVMI